MNYTTLFNNNKTRISIGNNLHCISGDAADVMELIRRNPYPILFVLEGELEVRFRTDRNLIKQGHFAVVASANLGDCLLAPSSVVMVFYPSERFARYLGTSSKVFKLSISEILPIHPSLQGWIDEQLEHVSADGYSAKNGPMDTQLAENNPMNTLLAEASGADSNDRARCLELVRILIAYPRDSINTLFMPLYACSIHNCKNCKV